MTISIVIPAYNEEKYIGKTLESVNNLEKEAGWETEVVVVNGDSTDKTADVAKKYGARVIDEPHKRIGFARQQGLLAAKGEIVAFTDADTVVPSFWLKKYVEVLSKKENVCAYGTYRLDSGKFPYYHITNYIQPPIVSTAFTFGLYLAGGQNLAAKRDVAIKIGGFDEKLAMLEDADFVKRMSKYGRVVFLPDNVVLSSGRRSGEGWRYFLRAGIADFNFFVLGKRKFEKFPDFR
jgi:glycosyltransferase involved in cell wall biosynthesis